LADKSAQSWGERNAAADLRIDHGHELMEYFLRGSGD
jgi:hypothetical protein